MARLVDVRCVEVAPGVEEREVGWEVQGAGRGAGCRGQGGGTESGRRTGHHAHTAQRKGTAQRWWLATLFMRHTCSAACAAIVPNAQMVRPPVWMHDATSGTRGLGPAGNTQHAVDCVSMG